MEEREYTLSQLSEMLDVPVRTIRYYVQRQLLPRPQGKGPNSRYGFEHLAKLAVIRRLQDDGASLDAIGRVMDELDDESVRSFREYRTPTLENPDPTDVSLAQDYAQMVGLGGPVVLDVSQDLEALPSRDYGPAPPRLGQRSHWERITITSSIELHVRRPLPSSQRKGLHELVEVAKLLFRDRSS